MHILDKTEAYYWLTIDTCSKQIYGFTLPGKDLLTLFSLV